MASPTPAAGMDFSRLFQVSSVLLSFCERFNRPSLPNLTKPNPIKPPRPQPVPLLQAQLSVQLLALRHPRQEHSSQILSRQWFSK